ncbi:ArsR/SmtB family transcription factor [Agrobacterium rosae]|uniref:Helix-turn-helix domain-containing protein n=1 Tax=Agrobacterium rosae TaxID=1972867 RepID=A0AAE5RYR6_9HYPH|nr:helix-turn-helix domain-containing protein [Agrobacterium rosae]KAA3511708.1 ArsR family transcriptional regulator [Agrobacterium rosae]KAA3519210.1 ArsR family transcriptional regulator [Agrobacterium rosae]MCM2436236.1 helix-turn-helix transcriptional regulator [Agrobacterium rosae]MDX8332231.1 helix-turn-helix domain-containing protein [Agrobacterium rosae]MQB49124.1 ArsR family transcriptional regulator [Agrobacterium rosae]
MRAIPHPALEDVNLTQVLYALSDPVRLEVVRQLANGGQATCSALDGGRPKSSMSHHFKVLREGGLVFTRTDGPAHLNELRRKEIDERFPGLLDAVLPASDEAG